MITALLIAHLALIVGSLALCWFLDEPDADQKSP